MTPYAIISQPARKGICMNVCQRCPRASICLPARITITSSFEFESCSLTKGEHVFYQGQISRYLYILRAGALKSYTIQKNGDEFVMGFYFPTDLFGWEAIDEQQRSISVIALDESNICMIPAQKLFLLTQNMPALNNQLLQMISRRIQQDNIALLRTTAEQRVATFLLQLNSRYAALGLSPIHLRLPMTHHDIANYLRITPSTISRIFHQWEKRKWIVLKNHMISLVDAKNLQMAAEMGKD